MPAHPRRRSCLTVPGGSEKMLRKAAGLAADEIVLDLEDAVAPALKDEARRLVVETLRDGLWRGRSVAVRINASGTPWHEADLAALAVLDGSVGSIVVPKVGSVADVSAVEASLGDRDIGLQLLIESAQGLAHCVDIAAAGKRVQSLIVGYGDLASSLGRGAGADWSCVQEMVLVAARAAGLQAIDGPCFDLGAGSPLAELSARSALQGFDGRWAIHPAQIEIINAAYTPGEAAAARARGVLAALDAADGSGSGVAIYEGAMVDEAMRLGALRVLSRVEDRA